VNILPEMALNIKIKNMFILYLQCKALTTTCSQARNERVDL
jgi:hypothetical protein